MQPSDIFRVWRAVLEGRRPFLSVELTRECPLRCPGCYAYEPGHLGSGNGGRDLPDLRGQALVDGVLDLVRTLRPLHLSIVGGEPLVRWRELNELLPLLHPLGVEVQLVTSAVLPVPAAWAGMSHLHLAVSVDGLPDEHDRRRSPATYQRVLENIAGQQAIIHCTITPPMLARGDYLEDFARFWSGRPEARKLWFSLFTPQHGADSKERLTPAERLHALHQLERVRERYPKVDLPSQAMDGFRTPPASPRECIFAALTKCVAADLETPVLPCPLGGTPVCAECGCLAAAGMFGVGRMRLGRIIPLEKVFRLSQRIGRVSAQGATS